MEFLALTALVAGTLSAFWLFIRKHYFITAGTGFLMLCGVYTWLAYQFFDMTHYKLAFYANLSPEDLVKQSSFIFIKAGTTVAITAAFISFLFGVKIDFSTEKVKELLNNIVGKYDIIIVISVIIYTITYIYSYGSEIFIRYEYIPENRNDLLYSIVKIFTFPIFGILSIYSGKYIKYLLLFIIIALDFSASSRSAAVGLIIFSALSIIIGRRSFFWLLGSTVIVIYLFVSVLYARGLGLQGLYFNFLSSLDVYNMSVFFVENLNYIFLAGVAAAAYSTSLGLVNPSDFWAMINPLPGFIYPYDDNIIDNRINESAPVPAIVQIFGSGSVIFYVFYCILGVSWSLFDIKFSKKTYFLYIFASVFFLIGIAMSTQYNLRTFTRFLYYPAFLTILIYSWSRLFRAGKFVLNG